MNVRFRKQKDFYFIDVDGNLDLNDVDRLKSFCLNNKFKKKKVIFNLKALDFVGSKGVEIFSETLDFINKNNDLKICCAQSEFKKVFQNEGLSCPFFSSEEEAEMSFSQNECPPKYD